MPKSMSGLNKKSRKIYLDYASSSLLSEPNPGAIHSAGVREKGKLQSARNIVAGILNARNDEIIFTSGATESNNLAIFGLVRSFHKPHIVTSNIEHASVIEVCKHLEKTRQAEVTYVGVEPSGVIDPKKIKEALRSNTVLVSIMYANNEIGTIQPIREIGKEIRHYNKINSKKIFFHTDAAQAVNYLPIKVSELGVDMMSINGAKIYGPKGVGVLYIKKGAPVLPIMFGGNQEFGLRPGTENTALAFRFAKAFKDAEKMKGKETKRLTKLRDYFFEKLKNMSKTVFDTQNMSKTVFDTQFIINGDLKNRLPNNINITIPNIPSELLVIELSQRGIMVSAKSACKSGDAGASYVIEAINPRIKKKDGSLRFSLGRGTTKKDIDDTIRVLSLILTKLKKWYTPTPIKDLK